jgi:hypothetical protein
MPASVVVWSCREFGAPAIEVAEIAGQRLPQFALRWLSSPNEAENSSCRIIELLAMSSSRFRPLITKPDVFAKSSSASCAVIELRRLTAPP